MRKTRDLTKAQFERAMIRMGWEKDFFGYWTYGGVGVHPTIFLDGKKHYRQKLQGMSQQKDLIDAKQERATA